MDGIFSLVAIIPVVGQGIGNGLRWLYNLLGKPVVNIIKKLTTNGKGAAKMFFDLFTTAGKKAQGFMKPIMDLAKTGASKIAGVLNKVNMKSLNNTILDASWGWIGFPSWIVKLLDGFVSQLRQFFTHIAKPPPAVLHVTQKGAERGVHKFLPHEEKEKAEKVYNTTDKVDKKLYPTLEDYLDALLELKNKKELKLKTKDVGNEIAKVGEQLNNNAVKSVLAWMKKKEGNEIKLWSKYDAVVKLVQKAVGVKPDGSFGTGTEKAVKIAQKKHGLSPDGVVGPETWKKLTATNFRT
jgi:peptidoglycan hydrolase-like protein with peptidoglycan-binding domain